MDFDTHRAHDADLPVVLHVRVADLLHDYLPGRHCTPLQQVFPLGEGDAQVGQAAD